MTVESVSQEGGLFKGEEVVWMPHFVVEFRFRLLSLFVLFLLLLSFFSFRASILF